MDKPFKGYSVSWTQPYGASYNPFYQSVESCELELELDRLDAIDLVVDQMTEYPEAAQIIKRIMGDKDVN